MMPAAATAPEVPAISAAGAPRPSARFTALTALAAALAWAITQAVWIDEPFDASLGQVISAGYLGVTMRAADAGASPGAADWTLFFHPRLPEVRLPYFNHPGFILALYRPAWTAFGRDERALRIVSLALAAIALLALSALAIRRGGARLGALALALAASAPAMLQYGNLLCPPLFALPWTMLALLAFAWRDAPPSRVSLAAYCLFAFAAALSDWNAYGLVPALWLWIAMLPGARGRRRALAVLVALPFAAGAAAWALHAAVRLGGLSGLRSLGSTIGGALVAYDGSARDILAATGGFAGRLFGWPLLAAAAAGGLLVLARALAPPRPAADPPGASPRLPVSHRLALALLVAALVPCAVFWSRTGTHEFWLLLATPAVALLAAIAIEAAARGLSSARGADALAAGAALLIAGWGVLAGLRLHDEYRSEVHVERGLALDRLGQEIGAGPDDVFLFTDYDSTFAARFYSHAAAAPMIADRGVFERAMEVIAPAAGHIPRVWIACPAADLERHGWIEPLVGREEARDVSFAGRRLALAPLREWPPPASKPR